MRARNPTLEEIRVALGFSSRGAVKSAIDAELARTAPDAVSPERARRYLLESAKDTARRWHDKFEQAYKRGDIEAMAESHRGLCRDRDLEAKLVGAYASQRVEVEAIDERQFAEQAIALLRVTGIKPLVELAAPVLSPEQRAELFAEPPRETYDPTWSNLGTETPYTPAEPAEPEPENEPINAVINCVDQDDETLEVVVAEIVEDEPDNVVALPTGQRRSPASEVLDEFGVPLSRGGVARRLGGYSPLAHWRP
jgi:hypothetical protein